jgi:osmotically-inducible protein OsmY
VIRRLFALLVLVGLVVFIAYYWKKYRPAERAGRAPDLEGVSEKIREGVGDVGERLRDSKVTGTVKTALELNRSTQPYSFNVDTENGVVTLRGDVPSEEVKREAESVAAAVPDVRQVVNQLSVNPGAGAPAGGQRTLGENVDDQKLEMQARLAFSLNRTLKGTDLEVQSFKRLLTVSGRVGTPAQKRVAIQIAEGLPDAVGVVDQVQVGSAPAAASSPEAGVTSATYAPLAKAAGAAQRALTSNPSLGRYGLSADEEGGKLVLRGTVKTAAEKELAGMVARDASGVASLENAIEVRP